MSISRDDTQISAELKPQKKPQRQCKKRQHNSASEPKVSKKLKQSSRKRSKSERLQPAGDLTEDFIKKQRQRLQQNFAASEPCEDQQELQNPHKVSDSNLLEKHCNVFCIIGKIDSQRKNLILCSQKE